MAWLDELKFDEKGLIPVIAQDAGSGEVLMVAFANRESLERTLKTGRMTYWSRSRGKLWEKGESSGHVQKVKAVFADCDRDVLLVKIEQVGGAACHTGRRSCFFHRLEGSTWKQEEGIRVFDPKDVYKK